MVSEKYPEEKVSPFVWVDALSQKKGDPMAEYGEAAYPAYMVNRAMSQYPDCVQFAAEINLYRDIPNRYSYDYYRNSLRPAKRYAKWGKKKTREGDVGIVMDHYEISRERAEEYLSILTEDQVKEIASIEKEKES